MNKNRCKDCRFKKEDKCCQFPMITINDKTLREHCKMFVKK